MVDYSKPIRLPHGQMWDHVDDETTRSVLNGDLSEDAVCRALCYAGKCLQADMDFGRGNLPDDVLDARFDACQAAHDAWNEQGNIFATVEALRRFWNI